MNCKTESESINKVFSDLFISSFIFKITKTKILRDYKNWKLVITKTVKIFIQNWVVKRFSNGLLHIFFILVDVLSEDYKKYWLLFKEKEVKRFL